MKYHLYTTSQKAWNAMLKAIEKAEKSIYLEMYIFLNDIKETHDFFGLLKRKAEAGLEVIVIADAYGSSALSSSEVKSLKNSGIEFFYFNNLFRRTHRKILIIDNKFAFLGGVNINEKIRNWRDLQIKISGKIVKPLIKSFAYVYKRVGGKKEDLLKYSRMPLKQKLKTLILDDFSRKNSKTNLGQNYLQEIYQAQKNIKIVSPYLVPPRRLLRAFYQAIHRGVEVQIIIPRDTDIKILNKINYLNAHRLMKIGVKVYLSKKMNHAKVLLVDDTKGLIGSQNLDILSFNFNIEAGVLFEQKALVSDLKNIFDHWLEEAELFGLKVSKPNFAERLLIFVFKIFYPIF